MKHWLATILALFFGCNQSQPPAQSKTGAANNRADAEQFVAKLNELGYFKFVAESAKETVRRRMVEAIEQRRLCNDIQNAEVTPDRRLYYTDAEGLSEGIARQITLMKEVLRQEGCRLDTIEDAGDQDRREVVINGTSYLHYDWPHQEPPDLDTWGLGHKRLVEIVGKLLDNAGSQERLYGIASFNDAKAILLTRDMFNYIRSRTDLIDEIWMPHSAEEMKLTHE